MSTLILEFDSMESTGGAYDIKSSAGFVGTSNEILAGRSDEEVQGVFGKINEYYLTDVSLRTKIGSYNIGHYAKYVRVNMRSGDVEVMNTDKSKVIAKRKFSQLKIQNGKLYEE